MSTKVVFAVCIQALFFQMVLCQCTSRAAIAADSGIYGPAAYGLGASYGYAAPGPYGYEELAYGAPCGLEAPWGFTSALDFTPTSGGALAVSSASAIPPTGISVISDNIYEGPLTVVGELPFVGTVAMDGVLPTFGAGVINHSCGDGVIAMVGDISDFSPRFDTAYIPDYAGAYVPSLVSPALGYRAEWADRGCGCGW